LLGADSTILLAGTVGGNIISVGAGTVDAINTSSAVILSSLLTLVLHQSYYY